jgi:hypothetical protein
MAAKRLAKSKSTTKKAASAFLKVLVSGFANGSIAAVSLPFASFVYPLHHPIYPSCLGAGACLIVSSNG